MTVKVFVHDPHHELVRKNTRFWSASGLDIAIGADGIRVDTESFVTLMVGGIAFDTPLNMEPGEPAEKNEVFKLYKNRESISEKTYARKERWLLHFDSGVRGLTAGAPVELQGIQMGEVLDVNLEFDVDKAAFSIPVLIEIEPDRVKTTGQLPEGAEGQKIMDYLVAKGLRAQLKTGSLITGQLLVAIDMHPEVTAGQNQLGRPVSGVAHRADRHGGNYDQPDTTPEETGKTAPRTDRQRFAGYGIRRQASDKFSRTAAIHHGVKPNPQSGTEIRQPGLNTAIAPELKSAVSNLGFSPYTGPKAYEES